MQGMMLANRYAVWQYVDGVKKRVGTIMANNFTHANTKALRLFNRHVWVERL
jgi:hypothetical protein